MRGDLVVERGTGNMWGRILTAGSGREFFSSCEKFSKTPSCYIYFYYYEVQSLRSGLQSIGHFLKSVDMEHLFEIIQP